MGINECADVQMLEEEYSRLKTVPTAFQLDRGAPASDPKKVNTRYSGLLHN